jgi:CHASE3 domain sensor protein
MRFRIPPFFPPYAVLVLVIAYAIGSLWLGLSRLDVITELTAANARNRATLHDLQALSAAVIDIEMAGRGFALTADESYLEPLERGRRQIPLLLSDLRDRMRDDTVELGLVEEVVSMIAVRTTITLADIERKRAAPDQPYEKTFGGRGKDSSEAIRRILATLEAREQDEIGQVRQAFADAIDAIRQELYLNAGVTLLLVIALFMAVRRLRSFIPEAPGTASGGTVEIAAGASPVAKDGGVGTLLYDALLRARLAAASAPAESNQGKHLRSLTVAMEQALNAHSIAYGLDETPPGANGVARAMAILAEAYSHANGLTIKTTIDKSASVRDLQKAFLIFRSAEWALEVITLRKRTGNVALTITTSKGHVLLRIEALTDDPKVPVTLTPKESEEANALRQGIAAVAGTFIVDEGPTGFSLALTVPA